MRTHRHKLMRPKPRTRRGVLILVVLGILVLFTMVGVAYVITAGQQVPAAKASAAKDMTGNRPAEQLKSVLTQLVRGTDNPNSSMLHGSLLEDLYGHDGFTGIIAWVPDTGKLWNPVDVNEPADGTGGQFLDLFVFEPSLRDFNGETYTPSQAADFYSGRVLTITSGPARGVSTRIVDYAYDPDFGPFAGVRFRVMAFRDSTGEYVKPGDLLARINMETADLENDAKEPGAVDPEVNARFVINGQPFDGTGAGFDPKSGQLNLTDRDPVNPLPTALLPNVAYLARLHAEDLANGVDPPRVSALEVAQGGVDESWDVADFQNMFLAFLLPDADEPEDINPSFHRRALINYMTTQESNLWNAATNPDYREFRRKVVMRPMPWDHPDFTGGNTAFEAHEWQPGGEVLSNDAALTLALIQGPWDIDNDGDLIADSIWIDAGLAVQSAPDGRQYKPLVAILCVDLDGRLNLNAHGTRGHYLDPATDPLAPVARTVAGVDGAGDPVTTASLPKGSGTGPAEINLGAIFNPGEYQELISGRWQWEEGADGAWGVDDKDDDGDGTKDNATEAGWPGSDDVRTALLIPGRYGENEWPGYPGLDPLTGRKFYEYPENYFAAESRSAFGSPPDLHGRLAFGLDHRGQPAYEEDDPDEPANADVRAESPYEMNLSDTAAQGQFSTNSTDMPFSVADLERLLRPQDVDSERLPDRLWSLQSDDTDDNLIDDRGPLSFDPDAPLNRRLVTTESQAVPAPNVISARVITLLVGEDGKPGNVGEDNGVNGPDDIAELGWPGSDDTILGPDKQPGKAGVNDNLQDEMDRGITPVVDDRLEIGWPGTDDALSGPDGQPGVAGVDDDGNGVIDDFAEMGWAGSDDISVMSLFQQLPIAEQLRFRLRFAHKDWSEQEVSAAVQRLVPPEVLMGLPMDLNRPFGNGRDDNGNQVVDEPSDAAGSEAETYAWTSTYGDVAFNHSSNGVAPGYPFAGRDARREFVRHLYVLAMLLKEPGAEIDFDGDPDNNSPLETARGIAQWAVNVADFRDADSAMTPFEYDTNPLDGWDVDEELGTNENDGPDGQPNSGDEPPEPFRGVVWGSERPEMLITEMLAWHDRRTEDLSNYSTTDASSNPDEDFDQRLRPRSALFIELYNPWASTDGFDDANSYDGRNAVRLDEENSEGSPKWRLLIFEKANPDANPDPDDPDAAFPGTQGTIERSIYFAQPRSVTEDDGQEYYTSLTGSLAPLLPGRFAMVGSGFDDGNGNFVNAAGRLSSVTRSQEGNLKTNQTRRIVLTPSSDPETNQFQVLENEDPAPEPPPEDMQPVIAVPIDQPRSVSISEPPGGYVVPGGHTWNPAGASGEGEFTPPIDEPFDLTRELQGDVPPRTVWNNGTTADFRTIYLQRLADPTMPWDAVTNPYRTIDSMSVDLTAFNGVPRELPASLTGTEAKIKKGGKDYFKTHQRGDQFVPQGMGGVPAPLTISRNLWNSERPTDPTDLRHVTPEAAVGPHEFPRVLQHTLGYLNEAYTGPEYELAYKQANAPPPTGNLPANFYVGAPDTTTEIPNPSDPGNPGPPAPPFPWLTWNNRPFISPMELTVVPRSRSSRLLREFTAARSGGPNNAFTNATEQDDPDDPLPIPFGYLPNFFHSEDPPNPQDPKPAHLYRLLEHVRVPSPFVGTETYLNPTENAFGGDGLGTESFRPPFNQVSEYREPGGVNVNTTASPYVWEGGLLSRQLTNPTQPWDPSANPFLQNTGHAGPDWPTLVASRRGYGDPDDPIILNLDPSVPTFFANPFRSPGAAELVPLDSMKRPGVEATLMRSNAIDQASSPGDTPLFSTPSAAAHNNTDRNAYFHYQGMQRVSSMLTTHSNVFAVWITIGYFEVQPVPVSAAHPDGFRLGAEMGSDTGEIKRHRAFYIVDRSIPVAAEPGEDHNVENTIRLQRFIE